MSSTLTKELEKWLQKDLNLYWLHPLKGTTFKDNDDSNRFYGFDCIGIRAAKDEECFKEKGVDANLHIRIVISQYQTLEELQKRLNSLRSHMKKVRRDIGSYHWHLSKVYIETDVSTKKPRTIVTLVRNYKENEKEKDESAIKAAPGHSNILEALMYDAVISDTDENFDLGLDGETKTNSITYFDRKTHQQMLKSFNFTTYIEDNTSTIKSSPDDSHSTTAASSSTSNCTAKCVKLFWDLDEGTKVIGRGAFGQVFLGWITMGDEKRERVAVKSIDTGNETSQIQSPQDAIKLNKEIQTLSRLNHEHIVKYYGSEYNSTTGKLNIICEYMPCGSLDKLIRTVQKEKNTGLGIKPTREYCFQILSGLVYLHGQNIAHLDLKPANILIGKNQCIKLADFDKCKQFGKDGTTWNCSKFTDSCIGTLLFSAPEVCSLRGQQVSMKSDIWSFVCTFVNMLTGKLPWYEQNFEQQMAVIGFLNKSDKSKAGPIHSDEMKAILRMKDIGPIIRDLISQCCEKDHKKRPSSKKLYDTHKFFDDLRWQKKKIQRRRSSDTFDNSENTMTENMSSPKAKEV